MAAYVFLNLSQFTTANVGPRVRVIYLLIESRSGLGSGRSGKKSELVKVLFELYFALFSRDEAYQYGRLEVAVC